MVQLKHGALTPETFAHLTQSVGWEVPPREQIEEALAHSVLTVCAFDEGKAVGMARLCGDGCLSYFLEDVAILPEYQGKGIGKRLVGDIIAFIKEREHSGWKVRLELISACGKEQFYKQFGFEQLPCEEDGSGMFLTLEK